MHHLEDNAGQIVLVLERSDFFCWPDFADSKLTVRSPTGLELRFASRTVQKSPGQLSVEDSRYELEFPDGTSLELKAGAPVLIPPGMSPVHPGSRFRYGDEELVFTIDWPVKPVWTSKEGKAFRALLPEDVADVMHALSDGHKAMREEAAFAGFDELFVSLYLGEEVGASGRDGYTVTEVKRAAQSGEKAKRIQLFSRRTGQDGGQDSPSKEPAAEPVPTEPGAGPSSPAVPEPSPSVPPPPSASGPRIGGTGP